MRKARFPRAEGRSVPCSRLAAAETGQSADTQPVTEELVWSVSLVCPVYSVYLVCSVRLICPLYPVSTTRGILSCSGGAIAEGFGLRGTSLRATHRQVLAASPGSASAKPFRETPRPYDHLSRRSSLAGREAFEDVLSPWGPRHRLY